MKILTGAFCMHHSNDQLDHFSAEQSALCLTLKKKTLYACSRWRYSGMFLCTHTIWQSTVNGLDRSRLDR